MEFLYYLIVMGAVVVFVHKLEKSVKDIQNAIKQIDALQKQMSGLGHALEEVKEVVREEITRVEYNLTVTLEEIQRSIDDVQK